ncbi:MAG: peptidoglycan-binding protein, partial [Clostridia bacterium]|nr:peptidoglycan-binding protein [Clostridia bacterium]
MDREQVGEVGEVQEKLRQIGIDRGDGVELAVDGIYGAETALAVSQFQRENGLPVTGKVDF